MRLSVFFAICFTCSCFSNASNLRSLHLHSTPTPKMNRTAESFEKSSFALADKPTKLKLRYYTEFNTKDSSLKLPRIHKIIKDYFGKDPSAKDGLFDKMFRQGNEHFKRTNGKNLTLKEKLKIANEIKREIPLTDKQQQQKQFFIKEVGDLFGKVLFQDFVSAKYLDLDIPADMKRKDYRTIMVARNHPFF